MRRAFTKEELDVGYFRCEEINPFDKARLHRNDSLSGIQANIQVFTYEFVPLAQQWGYVWIGLPK